MKKIILILICFSLWGCSPFAGDFKDKELASAISNELRNQDLSKKDYDKIKYLNLSFRDITSLEGIEVLTSLESLTLSNNRVESLEPLANLKHLKLLDVQNNRVRDLSPLKDIESLEVLLIRNNPVESIKSIENLFNQLVTTDFLVKVNFNDENFEAYIREQLDMPEGSITFFDLEKIRTIDLTDKNIDDITGIAYMSQLEKLIILNPVLGIDGLTHLKNLKHVVIQENYLNSFEFIKENSKIKYLDLKNNNIEKLEGIDEFSEIEYLDLSYNKVKNLSLLNTMSSLNTLYIEGNPILSYEGSEILLNQITTTDIIIVYFNDPQLDLAVRNQLEKTTGVLTLSSLKLITHLEAGDYGINNLSGIELLENLVSLNIENNNVSDLEPLVSLKKLSILKAKNNNVEELQPLVYMSEIRILDLKDNNITSVGPLQYLKLLEYLYLEGNIIEDTDLKTEIKNQVPFTDEW